MRGLISAHHLDGDVQRTARKNVLRGSRIFLVFLFCCRRLLSFLLCMFSFFSCFSNWRSAFESARVRFRVWYRMHSARQNRTRRRQKKKKESSLVDSVRRRDRQAQRGNPRWISSSADRERCSAVSFPVERPCAEKLARTDRCHNRPRILQAGLYIQQFAGRPSVLKAHEFRNSLERLESARKTRPFLHAKRQATFNHSTRSLERTSGGKGEQHAARESATQE